MSETETAIVERRPWNEMVTRERAETVRDWMRATIHESLPRTADPQQFVRGVMLAFARDQKILNCSMQSIREALSIAAELGLSLNPSAGEFYLVAYGSKLTPMTGYKGLLKLMANTGEIEEQSAVVVYSCDKFEPRMVGSRWVVDYTPCLDPKASRTDADITFAFYTAVLKGGRVVFEFVTRDEIEKRRACGQGGGPWKNHFAAMCRKTAIRKAGLGGMVPTSAEIVRWMQMEIDEDRDHERRMAGGRTLSQLITGPTEDVEPDAATLEAVDGDDVAATA